VKDLLLAVPSRGRPQNIARLLEAMDETCRGDTTLVLGLDDDDPELAAYLAIMAAAGLEDYVRVRSGLRQVVAWVNELAVPLAPGYRFTGHIGDDNVPRTDGWDVSVMEALETRPFAFGNDLYPRAPGTLCCHVFCRSDVIARLGYLGPPSIRHMYVDVAWMAWGTACGIAYLPDVVIEHLHYTTGKSPLDESYARSTALITGGDLDAWHAYSGNEGPGGLNADIARLGGRPFSVQSLRDFNASLNIPDRW
jgi:hypothetical protein